MEEKREALEHLYMMLKRFSKENDQDFNKILDIAIEIEPFFYRCSLTEKDINFFEHAYSVDRIHLENVEGLLREMLFHEARSCIHDFKNDTLFQLQEKIPLIYKDKPWILTQDLIQELTDDISGIFDPKYRVKMAEQSVLLCMPKFSSMKVH
ncbi:MAG TPA: hypothetical protein VIY47_11750 [Ignavibacteriaceae bacterium]